MLRFDNRKSVGTITIEKVVTEYDIESVIVTAFEGGSNYWMMLDRENKPEWEEKPKDEPVSTWATKLLIEGKSIKLCDAEETEDDSDWILTLEKLLKGIQMNTEKRPFDSNLDDMDATTADCIVQYALFGRIVFG